MSGLVLLPLSPMECEVAVAHGNHMITPQLAHCLLGNYDTDGAVCAGLASA